MDFIRRHRLVLLLGLILCLLLARWVMLPEEPASESASVAKPVPVDDAPAPATVPPPSAAGPAADAAQPPMDFPASFATLRGRVIDATTRDPIGEFEVDLQGLTKAGRERQGPETLLADDGRFERRIPAGRWSLVIDAAGHQRFMIESMELQAGQVTEEMVMPLRRGHRLRGRVYDETTGAGIASAFISFREAHVGRFEGNFRIRPHVTTQKDGAFVFEGVPEGRVTLMVSGPGHAGREVDIAVSRKTGPVEIALTTGGAIVGYLAAADGRTPVAGHAGLFNVDQGHGGSSRTGDAGEFSFENLQPGKYRLSGEAQGATVEREIVLTGNERLEGIVLALSTGRSIRGVVSGLRAEDLPQVTIMLRREGEFGDSFGTIGVDARGAYELRNVRPGTVHVVADAASRRQFWKVVEMPADADLTVNLEFPRGVRLSGRVTRAGKPVAGVWLDPRPRVEPKNFFVDGTSTSRTGEYVIEDMAAGEYTMIVGGYKTRTFTVSGDTVFDIDVPAANLTGRVLEEGGKVPIVGANVEVWPARADMQRTRFGDQSDHFGQFALIGLEPGDFVLTAHKPGYEMHRERLSYDSPVTDRVIRLRRDQGVRITVREAGSDMPMRRVLATEMIGELNGSALQLDLDENGVGYLPGALAGGTISFHEYGYVHTTITGWNGEPLELQLHRQQSR